MAYRCKKQPHYEQKYSEQEVGKNITLQQTSKHEHTFTATELKFHSV